MTAAIRRLTLLADVRRSRLALAALLGVLTILFGVGLMGTAGYLISRAAERPAILSLTAAIVGVRFFGLARPLARYLERLASHDVALRSLGNARARIYEEIEPLSPAQLQDRRHGDLLARFVADVDSLQNLYLRGALPPVVALVAGAGAVGIAAAILPQAALVLGVGLLVAATVVPTAAAALARRSSARQAEARGRSRPSSWRRSREARSSSPTAGRTTGSSRSAPPTAAWFGSRAERRWPTAPAMACGCW